MYQSPCNLFVICPDCWYFLIGYRWKGLFKYPGYQPFKGGLDSIGGFLDPDETFEQAALRELKEETGLDKSDVGPLEYLVSGMGHYPYKGETIPVLSVFYKTHYCHKEASCSHG